MPTISDLITSSFTELRVARAGDVIDPDTMATGLYVLNRLFDFLNADDRAVYSEDFQDYTLTPALSPHTIGPGGTFNVTQRPIEVQYAALNLGSSVYRNINVRDKAWYQRQVVPAITNTVPTDVYYKPDWPLGKLYFWGIPSAAYGLRLWTRTVLAAVALTDPFSMPPGYQLAIELTLAEQLASSMGQAVSQDTKALARKARTVVWGDNDDIPRISTVDGGMPCGSGSDLTFNWTSRSFNNS